MNKYIWLVLLYMIMFLIGLVLIGNNWNSEIGIGLVLLVAGYFVKKEADSIRHNYR